MNKEDEIIRQDYNRAVNMWNETYSKYPELSFFQNAQ